MEATATQLPQGKVRDFQDYLAELDTLLPIIEEEAEESERLNYMTDRAMYALRDAGMFGMLMPRELGGADLPHVEAMQIIERIAWAHASAGWCTLVNVAVAPGMALYIPDEGVKEIFGNGPDVMVSGNGVPRGFARRVEGGYMIRGHWAYGSAITHSDWLHTGCFLTENGQMVNGPDGGPEVIVAHHRTSTVEFKDNWDVLGLKATGSFDYVLKDGDELFVPDHLCYSTAAANAKRGDLKASLGLIGYPAWAHTSWALGVGRRMLDELVTFALGKSDAFGKICDQPVFKFKFAQAEAKFRAARALSLQSWQSIADSFAANKPATTEQLALVKICLRHVHDVISEVGTFAHRTARGTSLRDGIMQRLYRDIHSGTQHIILADQIFETCGRVLLGNYPPDARWSFFDLDK